MGPARPAWGKHRLAGRHREAASRSRNPEYIRGRVRFSNPRSSRVPLSSRPSTPTAGQRRNRGLVRRIGGQDSPRRIAPTTHGNVAFLGPPPSTPKPPACSSSSSPPATSEPSLIVTKPPFGQWEGEHHGHDDSYTRGGEASTSCRKPSALNARLRRPRAPEVDGAMPGTCGSAGKQRLRVPT